MRRWFGSGSQTSSARRYVQPAIEALEDRALPSTSVPVSPVQGPPVQALQHMSAAVQQLVHDATFGATQQQILADVFQVALAQSQLFGALLGLGTTPGLPGARGLDHLNEVEVEPPSDSGKADL
jgi:hypothetical protein